MSEDNRCRAIKRDDNRCQYPAKYSGFCGVHFPKSEDEQGEDVEDKTKLKDVVLLAGGVVAIVKAIVELWQVMPFGTGPKMPDAYNYLSSRLPNFWGSLPEPYTPFNKGPNTVDWDTAKKAYDLCQAALEDGRGRAEIEELTLRLLDTLQPPFARMLYTKLGDTD